MRNRILERFDLLKKLGGLPEPEEINEEWLYILKEETRNSILIEGFFVSEEELEEVLASGKPLKRSQEEALNYYSYLLQAFSGRTTDTPLGTIPGTNSILVFTLGLTWH